MCLLMKTAKLKNSHTKGLWINVPTKAFYHHGYAMLYLFASDAN